MTKRIKKGYWLYSSGKHAIYTDFRWSVAQKAYNAMFGKAKKYGVGFYDVSGSGKIYVPDSFGDYLELKKCINTILPPFLNDKKLKIGAINKM